MTTKDETTKPAAIEVAKEQVEQDDVLTISGVRVRLKPVSAALFQEVRNRIPEPQVPMWHNEEYNRDEPNPNDPAYLRAVEEANKRQADAVIDACVLFGIELVDGMPENQNWLSGLKLMAKRGDLDLASYDLNDPLELEFLYKRFIVAPIGLINMVQEISTVTPEDVERQGHSFRRKKVR